jgi:hypothetical protein
MKLFCSSVFVCISLFLFGQESQRLEEFENKTDLFFSQYVVNGFVDYKAINEGHEKLNVLMDMIEKMQFEVFSDVEKQAFFINVYNLIVIDQIVKNYPTSSVKEISGFFDRTKYKVGGETMTLNRIEKDILLGRYRDNRFHFVLVCGAKDCPKIWNKAYKSNRLEEQLAERTKAALNDSEFIKITDLGYGLSEIFKWNRFEFGGRAEVVKFINSYRDDPIDLDSKSSYYTYDWTLNDIVYKGSSNYNSANNSFRYVTSAAIPKGGIEIKIFNNLYSQFIDYGSHTNFRSTYFTTSISFLFGSSNRFNIGFVSRYRRVRNSVGESALDVFKSTDGQNSKQRFTAFGPQIRWAPSDKWPNLSIQSSLTFPIGNELSGGNGNPFLDWSGPVFLTQFFNDKSIGDKFSLFTEIDLLVEEIGRSAKANRVSTPITGIFSWFPAKNFTVYGLVGYSPYFVKPYDYFTQFGIGFKYQLSRNFEIEFLITDFSNQYLNTNSGEASTYNIGFRYSR